MTENYDDELPDTLCCDYCERMFARSIGRMDLHLVFPDESVTETTIVTFCRQECLLAAVTMWMADAAAEEDVCEECGGVKNPPEAAAKN